MADSTDERDPVEELAEEFFARRRRGERPTVQEYQQQYPDCADRIYQVFETLLLLEDLSARSTAGDVEMAALTIADSELGEFQLVREIGRGGMGVVYEAIQAPLDRRVAIKIMVAPPLNNRGYLERFEREAKTAGRLHHTHIVPVFGVGSVKGIHYFAMQYIVGQGLDSVLSGLRVRRNATGSTTKAELQSSSEMAEPRSGVRENNLQTLASGIQFSDRGPPVIADQPPEIPEPGSKSYFDWAAKLIADAADALAYAHRQGVVHRDIKPANLLLDEKGAVWITDFGLARGDDGDDLTATGQVVGTVRYMAPERFAGDSGPGVDTYALGLTLYELATLEPAYADDNKASLIDKIRRTEPKRPRLIDSRIPRDLETIVLKAICKEPARRYASAQEFGADLVSFLAGMPIAARRLSVFERALRWGKRHPIQSALTIGVFATLAVGSGTATALYLRSEENRVDAEYHLEAARKANALAEMRLVQVNEQKQAAEENLKQALAAVDEYFTKTSENRLLQLPGTQPLRRELLEEALKYYDSFAAQQSGQRQFETEVGIAQYRAGVIAWQIGKREEALAGLRKAVETLKGQVASQWTKKGSDTLGAALNHLGLTLLQLKQVPEAQAAMDRALEVHSYSAKRNPNDPETLFNLAASYDNRGVALTMSNRLDDAMKSYRKAAEIFQSLVDKHPKESTYRRHFARNLNKIGSIHHQAGDLQAAMAAYQKNLKMQEQLIADDPKNSAAKRDLSGTLNNLGTLYSHQGRYTEAVSAFRQSIAILEKSVAANPAVAENRTALAYALKFLGNALSESGKPAEGLEYSRRAVDELRRLARSDPKNQMTKVQYVVARIRMAEVMEAAKQYSEAVLTLDSIERDALELESGPQMQEGRAARIQIARNRASALKKMGRLDDARSANELADQLTREINERLNAKSPVRKN